MARAPVRSGETKESHTRTQGRIRPVNSTTISLSIPLNHQRGKARKREKEKERLDLFGLRTVIFAEMLGVPNVEQQLLQVLPRAQ